MQHDMKAVKKNKLIDNKLNQELKFTQSVTLEGHHCLSQSLVLPSMGSSPDPMGAETSYCQTKNLLTVKISPLVQPCGCHPQWLVQNRIYSSIK